jgi:hypothetical protein
VSEVARQVQLLKFSANPSAGPTSRPFLKALRFGSTAFKVREQADDSVKGEEEDMGLSW